MYGNLIDLGIERLGLSMTLFELIHYDRSRLPGLFFFFFLSDNYNGFLIESL